MDAETGASDEAASVPCAGCGHTMRLSYREALESDGQLKIYECHHCRTTTTVVAPSAD